MDIFCFEGLIHQASFNLPSASFYSLCLSVLQRLCRLIDRLSPGLFQNSPLYQYLHDLGHTDFEACPTATSLSLSWDFPNLSCNGLNVIIV
uniref:Uncharacterized protein n=1 Tax=Cynoglossus semilaevis TaxID=244447 RepID=A0A3P8VDG0_CYNSE